MLNFLKGIAVGIGGVAPGLSGSVLMVIFGLYQKVINAIGTLFKNFRKNLLFLVPLFAGVGVGIILFSKLVEFLLDNFEVYTRFSFLGLIIGTLPLFYKEVKKEGFSKKYYIFMAVAFAAGLSFTIFVKFRGIFPAIENPNFFQSVLLGLVVAASYIIPGVDSAVILSALGLYELWVKSIADLNFTVLIPAACGLVLGALVFSFIINKILKRYYTALFSIIFGLFLAIIPGVLTENCKLGFDAPSLICIILTIIFFFISLFLGDIQGNTKKIKKLFSKEKRKEK